MHLYFITRGRKRFVRWFIENLEDIFLPYTFKDKEGKKQNGQVQLVPRPIQLWELVFPEDQKENVLPFLADGYKKKYGKLHKLKSYLARILGLKPLTNKERAKLGQHKLAEHVGTHIIGTKKDKFKDGIERL